MASPSDDLARLEARLRQDLVWLKLPARSWVKEKKRGDGRHVYDVVVIGGGMCGLAATAQLKFLGIDNLLTVDRNEKGFEGPWATYARMVTLRSPKDLAGPALGLPALTYRAWHEARFGLQSFDDLVKIDRLDWMDYLRWYRDVLGLDVRNRVSADRIADAGEGLLEIGLSGAGRLDLPETVLARRVVLATGRDNVAGTSLPGFVRGLDKRWWAHSTEAIDWDALRGKRIAVIGAGASAMDNAGHALEHGAGSVHVLFRRADIPRVNKFTGIETPGTVVGFVDLPDETKWRFIEHATSAQVPPPRESVLRVSRHPNAHFHPRSPVSAIEADGDELVLTAGETELRLDYVILATGFVSDVTRQKEIEPFAGNVLRWSDVFTPPPGHEDAGLALSPYLGRGFEFMERRPGATPALPRIHCFSFSATLTHGKVSGDVPAVSEGAGRLGRAIACAFFREDGEAHLRDLHDFSAPELLGDEWRPAQSIRFKATSPNNA